MIQSELISKFNEKSDDMELSNRVNIDRIYIPEALNIFSLGCGDMSISFKEKLDGMWSEIVSILREYRYLDNILIKIEEPSSRLIFDYETLTDILTVNNKSFRNLEENHENFKDVFPIVVSNNVCKLGYAVDNERIDNCCCNLNGSMDIMVLTIEYGVDYETVHERVLNMFERGSNRYSIEKVKKFYKVVKSLSFKFIYKK